jgi:hypothetical protein
MSGVMQTGCEERLCMLLASTLKAIASRVS